MVSDEEEFAAGVGERAEAKCSSVVSVLDGSAHDSSEKRLITFYKRAIVFRPQPHDQSDRDHSYQRQSPSHLPGHKDADGDDDVIGRPFEFVLVHDEIAKMIESNGFYKFLIKNPIDSNALGLWIFLSVGLYSSRPASKSQAKIEAIQDHVGFLGRQRSVRLSPQDDHF